MVDLLSHHLYSGPQVYLRELLQNAVDALTARAKEQPDAPATVRLAAGTDEAGRPQLEITDTGAGLTAREARDLLATIGNSSKRDLSLGVGRAEFIGQFGIGLLAAFMVADRIEVTSQSMRPGTAPIRWTGYADGTFDLAEPAGPVEVGTTVRLRARAGVEHWLEHDTVVGLAHEFGSLLPFDVAVAVDVAGLGRRWRRVTEPVLPWRAEHPSGHARGQALAAYCERTFGFTPLGHIDLEVPLAGVSGVAFILPQAISPGSGRHRVYTKRMLLGPRIDGILPDWAFFVRAVLNSDVLAPTASREQLHDDEILLATREALGDQLKAWATATLGERSSLARRFINTHHLALRALALTDDDMLDLVARILPYETTDGAHTLAQVGRAGPVRYAATTEAYRRVAAVARAQGLVVVNAGYVYDADLMERLRRRPGFDVRELTAGDVSQVLRLPDPLREGQLAAALATARDVLAGDDCDVIVREFEPDVVPAVLLRDPEGEHRRDLDREREATPGLWDGLLDSFATQRPARSRTLALNDRSDVVRQLLAAREPDVFAAGLRSLYLSAVLMAGEGLRSAEAAALNDALSVLLSNSLRDPAEPQESPCPASNKPPVS
ncbi:MAG: HSP90 family protein [Micropruina sp.]|nr:MAG: HSP90 family protein [Micropruina sp.]